jgi:uncharacterized membrane protein
LAAVEAGVTIRRRGGGTVSAMADVQRMRWMRRAAERDQRIVDASMLAAMQGGSAFFISVLMVAVGGAIAIIGQASDLALAVGDLSAALERPSSAWIVKLFATVLMLLIALAHMLRSHRMHGLAMTALGAMPPSGWNRPQTATRASRPAGRLSVMAGRSHDRGVRAVVFALASTAWLAGPAPGVAAGLAVAATMLWRDGRSPAREAMRRGQRNRQSPTIPVASRRSVSSSGAEE